MRAKYGVLNKETWQADLRAGFCEAFRVLRPGGVLIFKWNETHISVSHILALTDHKPVVGHKSGKRSDTHWMTFLKDESTAKPESDPLLAYATRRIIELESLLKPDVPETVWPAEVHFLFDQVPAAGSLPADLQNKIRSHINRMKLDGMTTDAIIQQTVKLTAAMGATA